MEHRLNGPLGMLAGLIIFSFVPVLVKVAHNWGASAPVATFIRFAVGLLCVAVLVALAGQRLRTSNFRVLALRGLFGGAAVLLYFVGVESTGAGMGTLLTYTNAIWGNALAVIVFRQKPPRSFWFLLLAGAAGLYLVIDPETSFERPGAVWGTMAGLLSGLLGGAAILCIKRLRETDEALTIFCSFTVVGLLVGCLALCPSVLRRDFGPLAAAFALPCLAALVSMGLLSFAAQILFTAGYKNTSIQLGSLLSLTVPVLAMVNGRLFLGEEITFRFVLGAAMVLGACGGVGAMEKLRQNAVD